MCDTFFLGCDQTENCNNLDFEDTDMIFEQLLKKPGSIENPNETREGKLNEKIQIYNIHVLFYGFKRHR